MKPIADRIRSCAARRRITGKVQPFVKRERPVDDPWLSSARTG